MKNKWKATLVCVLALLSMLLMFVLFADAADARSKHKHRTFAYLAEGPYDLEGAEDLSGFGDSLTSGAVDPVGGFLVRLSEALEVSEAHSLTWHKFVKGGSPSAFWALALGSGLFDDYLARSERVSVVTGAADMIYAHALYAKGACGALDNEECYRQIAEGASANWDTILGHLEEVAPEAQLYCGVYFDPFADYDPPMAHEAYKRHLTDLEEAVAAKCEAAGGTFLDFHLALNGPSGEIGPVGAGLMADAIHPNAEGHWLMAESAR